MPLMLRSDELTAKGQQRRKSADSRDKCDTIYGTHDQMLCFYACLCFMFTVVHQVYFTPLALTFSQVRPNREHLLVFVCHQHMTHCPTTLDNRSVLFVENSQIKSNPNVFGLSVDTAKEKKVMVHPHVCLFICAPTHTHHYSMAPPYEVISVTDLLFLLFCHQLRHIAWLP